MKRRASAGPRPERAIVLAAGFGTRLLPLTRLRPKPLLPLWGVPMLEHSLRLLRRWGVRKVLVNGHHGADQVFETLRRRAPDGLQVNFSYEPEILGTGGVLKRAAWFLDDRPCWMINADVAADLDPAPFLKRGLDAGTLAVLWLHDREGPRTVEMEDGLLRTFESSRAGSPGTYTFCGLHYFDRRILRFIEGEGFSSIITAYQRAMAQGLRVAGVAPAEVYWADVGTPEQYLKAHAEIRARHASGRRGAALYADGGAARALRQAGVVVSGWVSAPADAQAARGAEVKDAVLLDAVRLDRTARVAGAVLAPGARAAGTVSRLGIMADAGLEPAERAVLVRLGLDPSRTLASIAAARGSSRQFVRLRCGAHRAVLVRYDPAREENGLYAGHARFLARLGLRVPSVLADVPSQHFTLLEDLGEADLLGEVQRRGPARCAGRYREVLEQVARLHERGGREARRLRRPLMPPFAPRLYRWEREWFAEQYLRRHRGEGSETIAEALRELTRVERSLRAEPHVLLHRDLQSTNIFLTRDGPAFIDFQGMRLGPAAYDLASLLCDPYVSLPPEMIEELLRDYGRLCPAARVSPVLFWRAAMQRLAQALGAYGRLSRLPGNESFAAHIGPACRLLCLAIDRSGLDAPVLRGLAADAGRPSKPDPRAEASQSPSFRSRPAASRRSRFIGAAALRHRGAFPSL